MASEPRANVTLAEAKNLVEKLQAFRDGLPSGEKSVLDGALRFLQDRSNDPSVRELLADFPEGPELLDDVAGFAMPEQEAELITTVIVIAATLTPHIEP